MNASLNDPELAEEIRKALDPAISVREDGGYAAFFPGDLEGFDRVRRICLEVFRKGQADLHDKGRKSYLRPMLEQLHIDQNPELVEYALNPKLLAAAGQYLGCAPALRSIQYLYTPQNQTEDGSQMLHFDHIDGRQLKLFVYLTDIDADTGPFVFIPADDSDRVLRSTGLTWDEAHTRRFEDHEVEAIVPKNRMIMLTGPAGAGGMVDTTRCLHFGGRARRGERHMMIIQYTRPGAALDTPAAVQPRHAHPERLSLLQRRAVALEFA